MKTTSLPFRPVLAALAAAALLLSATAGAHAQDNDDKAAAKAAAKKEKAAAKEAKKKDKGEPKERRNMRVTVAGKPAGEAKATRLFILSGQSNMAGMDERKVMIATFEKAFPDDELIFVKDAQSGQPIRRWAANWQPATPDWEGRNGRDRPGNNDLYQRLMERVEGAAAGKKFASVSFMWMQGEADAKQEQSANYEKALRGLVEQVRTDMDAPEATVVIGRLSDHQKGDVHWDAVRAAQEKVGDDLPNAAWIDTDEYNGSNNDLHYMGQGMDDLSVLFAEKTIALLKK